MMDKQQKALLIAPPLLIISTAVVFRGASGLFGEAWAVLLGFGFYQAFWCMLFPVVILGRKSIIFLFAAPKAVVRRKNFLAMAILSATVLGALPFLFANIGQYHLSIFLLGIPLTTINAFCEETFWRGLYVKKFDRPFFTIVFPTLFFSVWHFSSEMVDLNLNFAEALPFVLMTVPLGLAYGFVAHTQKSIRWTAICHSLSGVLAFGVPLSTSLAAILGLPGGR